MADCRECNTFDTCIEVKGYQEGAIVGGYCINFTPKPAEPEKVKKTCKTCAVSSFNNGGVVCANFTCIIGDNHTKWQPIPKPAEKPKRDAHEQWLDNHLQQRIDLITSFSGCNPIKRDKPKPKSKENKMKIGIFKFSVRRYVMACTLIVTAKIAIALNPVVSLWDRVIPPTEGMSPYHNTAMNWFFTLAAIAAIIAAVYAYNRATAWLFGESK